MPTTTDGGFQGLVPVFTHHALLRMQQRTISYAMVEEEMLYGREVRGHDTVIHVVGRRDASGFDLATGRLCVMVSRHQVGLVVVSRDHVGDTLDGCVAVADQAPCAEDSNGRGHALHTAAWRCIAGA